MIGYHDLMATFTKDRLIAAFTELGEIALQAGKVIDIAVYGGSCLMLVSNFRMASEDVDAVAIGDQGFIDEAARVIAAREGWPADWLNDGVRTYLSPAVDAPEDHALFATYPGETRPGLRVYVPSPEYMLAIKTSMIFYRCWRWSASRGATISSHLRPNFIPRPA
jgi:hypothetical protein